MSKRRKSTITINGKPVYKITEKSRSKLALYFRILRDTIHIWEEVVGDPELENEFCTSMRNQLFDATGIKFFESGLYSEEALLCVEKSLLSKDHAIQRTKVVSILCKGISDRKITNENTFIRWVKKYAFTVVITKEQHKNINRLAKEYPTLTNIELYEVAGIKIPGMDVYLRKNGLITKASAEYFTEK